MDLNSHYEKLFDKDSKAAAFDRLAELFYNKNFSNASKTEIELLMFDIYFKATIDKNKNEGNVLDYVASSNYEISTQLGITQEKVRNLKIRKQLRYPEEFEWQESLLSLKENIRYDRDRIVIPVDDPNLLLEIKNYIKSNGGFIDVESGSDYIRIRVEYFIKLMYYTLDNENKVIFVKEFKKQFKAANSSEDKFNEVNKIEKINDIISIISGSTELLGKIIPVLKPSNPLVSLTKYLTPFIFQKKR